MRRCNICDKAMNKGFLIFDTLYYCSPACYHKDYTEEEYLDLYKNDEAFYTEWPEDEED